MFAAIDLEIGELLHQPGRIGASRARDIERTFHRLRDDILRQRDDVVRRQRVRLRRLAVAASVRVDEPVFALRRFLRHHRAPAGGIGHQRGARFLADGNEIVAGGVGGGILALVLQGVIDFAALALKRFSTGDQVEVVRHPGLVFAGIDGEAGHRRRRPGRILAILGIVGERVRCDQKSSQNNQ